jgi:hypothetical protein
MEFGPITFLAPLALFGLLSLPIIWWIMRITPPKPIEQIFPPLRLLMDVKKEEETPQSTPIWLLLFRLLLAAILSIALAKPILFQRADNTSRPLVMVIDDGWAAAGNWNAVLREAEDQIEQMISENKKVALLSSVDTGATNTEGFIPATQALTQIKKLRPKPLIPDRNKIAEALKNIDISQANTVWLSDGVDYGQTDMLRRKLQQSKSQNIYLPTSEFSPILAGASVETANGFRSHWSRLDANSLRNVTVGAYNPQGRITGRAALSFAPGQQNAEADFDLPAELRRQISQLKIEELSSAGSTVLFDDSWGRPLVGLLAGSDANAQPLLSEWHFIEKALNPNADIYKGDLEQLLAVSPSIIIMSDRARNDSQELITFVEEGGLLIRFAGPKLAKRKDALIPVALREGDRDLGGALAWEDPQSFESFAKESPFFGLNIDENITVKKQLMAQPGNDTDIHTWARLKDGSPVITSAPRGLGRIVLFHVTAGPEWSELPLSGLYVQMLKRILPLARSSTAPSQSTNAAWVAENTLDGFGVLAAAPPNTLSIENELFDKTAISATHLPGLYRQGIRRKALNTVKDPSRYTQLDAGNLKQTSYEARKPKSLMGFLLGLAALLIAADVIFALIASGRLRFSSRGTTQVVVLTLAMVLSFPEHSHAQSPEQNDALDLHLAYVITGNSQIDRMSKSGLEGLAIELTRRTTIEPKGVRGIDINTDDLDFYPFLYWPVSRDVEPLSDAASKALNAYMASGGTIVFDTQDQDRQKLLGFETHPGMAIISKSLDIPRLSIPSKDHVITKSFYLLQVFAGRWADGKIWLEAANQRTSRDGVSSVVVGSNDWAAAWAKDDMGRSIAVIETDIPRQREMAFRFGVNLTMYALAGNYKGDQVHAATLIKRLGGTEQQIRQTPDNGVLSPQGESNQPGEKP